MNPDNTFKDSSDDNSQRTGNASGAGNVNASLQCVVSPFLSNLQFSFFCLNRRLLKYGGIPKLFAMRLWPISKKHLTRTTKIGILEGFASSSWLQVSLYSHSNLGAEDCLFHLEHHLLDLICYMYLIFPSQENHL